jgi:hypothetical protein
MWRDALLFDQPVQHWSRSVGGIPDKPLRLETKALLRSLDHGLRRADLGLANGTGCFDVNDDAELHIDEIVVRVSEECPVKEPKRSVVKKARRPAPRDRQG